MLNLHTRSLWGIFPNTVDKQRNAYSKLCTLPRLNLNISIHHSLVISFDKGGIHEMKWNRCHPNQGESSKLFSTVSLATSSFDLYTGKPHLLMEHSRSVPATSKAHRLGSRFAMDEIDAIEIHDLVNESYSIECLPSGKFQFRLPGPKITANEVQ